MSVLEDLGRAEECLEKYADKASELMGEGLDLDGLMGNVVYYTSNHINRAREKLAVGGDTDCASNRYVREAVWNLTGGLCAYCNTSLPIEWHVDHLVPRNCGGPDNIANYVPACPSCNTSKNADHVIQFINRRFGRDA